jgi:hypothetical protein
VEKRLGELGETKSEDGLKSGQIMDLDLLFSAPKVKKETINYFEVLGITPTASDLDIRNAYIRQKQHAQNSLTEHQHQFMDGPSLRQYLDQLEDAYRILSHKSSRENYLLAQLGGQHERYSPTSPANSQPARNPLIHTSGRTRITGPKSTLTVNPPEKEEYQNHIRLLLENCEKIDGQILKQIRELNHVSLQDLHAVTRVNIEFLQALEDGDFATLPEFVYVKGFLRAILKYLKVEQGEFLIQELMKPIMLWKAESKNS